jgi:hypothetical protein
MKDWSGRRYEIVLIVCTHEVNMAHTRTIAATRSKLDIDVLLEQGDRFYAKEVPDSHIGKAKVFKGALDMIQGGYADVARVLACATKRP